MVGFVQELQQAAARVLSQAGPAVVRIGRGWGRGAGFVLRDGMVVTNAHNLRGAETTVTFADGRVATGTALGVDTDGDLAVLQVDTAGATALRSAGDTEPVVGTPVWALTSVAGGGLRLTQGTISAVGQDFRGPRGRRIAGSLEHTAPLLRGSSGGPVLDHDGRLLGINTHRLGSGFYLAVPVGADFAARVDALARGEAPSRVRLGVALAPPGAARRLRAAVGLPAQDGLLIRGVEPASPADRAGLRVGDLIAAAAGRDIKAADELFEVLDTLADGASLTLAVVRGTERLDVTVTFDAGPAPAAEPA